MSIARDSLDLLDNELLRLAFVKVFNAGIHGFYLFNSFELIGLGGLRVFELLIALTLQK